MSGWIKIRHSRSSIQNELDIETPHDPHRCAHWHNLVYIDKGRLVISHYIYQCVSIIRETITGNLFGMLPLLEIIASARENDLRKSIESICHSYFIVHFYEVNQRNVYKLCHPKQTILKELSAITGLDLILELKPARFLIRFEYFDLLRYTIKRNNWYCNS